LVLPAGQYTLAGSGDVEDFTLAGTDGFSCQLWAGSSEVDNVLVDLNPDDGIDAESFALHGVASLTSDTRVEVLCTNFLGGTTFNEGSTLQATKVGTLH
jgi:hypothetical protein